MAPAEPSDNDVKYSLAIALRENNNKNVYDLSHRNDFGSKVMTHSKQFQYRYIICIFFFIFIFLL